MTRADIAEADRIKARIRGAQDRDQMQQVVNEEREAVAKLEQRAETRVLAIQIRNLKDWVMRVKWPAEQEKRHG